MIQLFLMVFVFEEMTAMSYIKDFIVVFIQFVHLVGPALSFQAFPDPLNVCMCMIFLDRGFIAFI